MRLIKQLTKTQNLKICFLSALFLPLIVACSSAESSSCSRMMFQPHGSSAFNNSGPVCPESKIYSYDPSLFEQQATWAERSKNTPDNEDSTPKKKKSSI